MINKIKIKGKIFNLNYILPEKIKDFLKNNNINENDLLKDYGWESHIEEDLFDQDIKGKNLVLVINYIHITQQNQIRLNPEEYAKGKKLVSPSWTKGSFFQKFSIGYSIFLEA